MGDQEDGVAVFMRETGEELDDVFRILLVEVAGRFVSQEDAGFVGKSSGNGNPLLFAAGELVGHAVGLVTQPDLAEEFPCIGFHFLFGLIAQFAHGQEEILQGSELTQ